MRRVAWIWIAIAVMAGCGPKQKNQCPDTTAQGCITDEVCGFDQARGCRVCQCRSHGQGKTGTEPDDTNPPIPVH
jgi:hypothetical protein